MEHTSGSDDLTIILPPGVKEQLLQRFSEESIRATRNGYIIEVDCPLCKIYFKHIMTGCGECPFKRFYQEGSGVKGCISWLFQVIIDLDKHFTPKRLALLLGLNSLSWDDTIDLDVRFLCREVTKLAKLPGAG